MERQNVKFTTPSGKEFEVINKLNAGERNDVRRVMLSSVKLDVKPTEEDPKKNSASVSGVDPNMVEMREHALIKVAVKRYGELTTGILEAILQDDPEDYDFVVAKVEEVLSANANFF